MNLKETIHVLNIVNDGTGTKTIGNYKYEVVDCHSIGSGISSCSVAKTGEVKNHKRANSVWKLLSKILKEI